MSDLVEGLKKEAAAESSAGLRFQAPRGLRAGSSVKRCMR